MKKQYKMSDQMALGVFDSDGSILFSTAYKKNQYDRWKESVELLQEQAHFSEKGIKKLLELTYGLAEKGKRQYSKQQYLDWGMKWLNDPSRQKRKPKV